MGGAPVNFACHCQQLGANGIPISSIGSDHEGRDILSAIKALHLDVNYLQVDKVVPTGSVDVLLDKNSKPTYKIRENVAWDFIYLTNALLQLAPQVDAVCFGTLAQRSEISRTTIQHFVELCPVKTLKIFDVNLRQSFYSKHIIESALNLANILKVSDEELPVLADMFNLEGSVLTKIRQLITLFGLRLVAYTRGADGSMLVTGDTLVEHPGCKPNAIDTVGAGDSYTATMCVGLLTGHSLDEIISHASRVSAYVCEHVGATPELPAELHYALEVTGEGDA